jgi:hypothetical protein
MERRHKLAAIGGTGLSAALVLLAGVLTGFDWQAWGLDLTKLVVPVVAIPVLYFARLAVGTYIPKSLLPVVGVALATAGDFLHTLVAGGTINPILVVLLAGVADILYTIAKEAVGDAA